MKVCLVRHAIAVERGAGGYQDDRARPLTPEGRRRMAEAARGLRSLVRPEQIHISPVLRARQTATILAKAWDAEIKEMESLGNGDHQSVLNALEALSADSVALVGHEPWLSELLSLLLTDDAGSVSSEFKKGSAALVQSDGRSGAGEFRLLWLMPPSALRQLGK